MVKVYARRKRYGLSAEGGSGAFKGPAFRASGRIVLAPLPVVRVELLSIIHLEIWIAPLPD